MLLALSCESFARRHGCLEMCTLFGRGVLLIMSIQTEYMDSIYILLSLFFFFTNIVVKTFAFFFWESEGEAVWYLYIIIFLVSFILNLISRQDKASLGAGVAAYLISPSFWGKAPDPRLKAFVL